MRTLAEEIDLELGVPLILKPCESYNEIKRCLRKAADMAAKGSPLWERFENAIITIEAVREAHSYNHDRAEARGKLLERARTPMVAP